MRVFIAVDIGEEIQAGLGDLQKQLQDRVDFAGSDVKWVDPELIHLTLKFLGEVGNSKVADVCDIVAKTAGGHKRFELDVAGLGYFGKNAAKVLWVGTGQNKSLLGLQKDIEQALAAVGWAEDARQFAGHLTLCRIRNPKAGRKLAAISKDYQDLQIGSWTADSVCVYQSRLTPAGPVYTALSRTQLSS